MYQGPGVYQHYKGAYYFALGAATHSETREQVVVYVPLYVSSENAPAPTQMFVRPLKMWNELVRVNISNELHRTVPRFRLIKSDLGQEQPFERFPG